jgi:site-specific DNA recombinase
VPLGYRCVDKKLEIVPEEAEAVQIIFTLYLELGSMGPLLAELDRRGIRTKVNGCRESQKRGGIRFGVGPLAHLLKNRFYIGEVHYRGEVYRGEHEPILGRDVFDAVQEKLAANAVDRQVRLKGSAAILINRLFDDRGNRMSPTHANKKGVRYRYYVSQALLQNRKGESGSIARASAPEVESLVCDGVRRQLASMGRPELANSLTDRELIERLVARVIITPQALKVCLILQARHRGMLTILLWTTRLPATPCHDHASLDRAKSRRCERDHSSAQRKTDYETREPRRSARRNRQGPQMDRRHSPRPL